MIISANLVSMLRFQEVVQSVEKKTGKLPTKDDDNLASSKREGKHNDEKSNEVSGSERSSLSDSLGIGSADFEVYLILVYGTF